MGTPRRIAVAGFQHETNTFAPTPATFEEFVKADAWPGLTRGADVFDAVAGMNLPITGFVDAARVQGHELLPILWCSAEPSSYVTRDAFERIVTMICDGLTELQPFDAVYLDLHGAMVAEHHEDAEGEVLRRVRVVLGSELPVAVSLDLHANVTGAMVEHAAAMTIFRTYPHLDMAATGARAFRLLHGVLNGTPLAKAFRKLPFLVPLTAQCTDFEPNRSIYDRAAGYSDDLCVDYAAGFPPADIHDCGPAVVVYGEQQAAVDAAAADLLAFVMNAEATFDNTLLAPDEAVNEAMNNAAEKPVVLADAQDNPGAGGSSDTVGIIEALVRQHAQGAVVAVLDDPEVATQAHEAGEGNTFAAALGGKSGQPGQSPYHANFHVERLGDGRFTCTGAMYRGAHTQLGPMALLRVAGDKCDVRIIVGSHRFQCLDQAVFRHLGVEPGEQRILVVKSTVHFRADFDPIAARTLIVEAPGAHPCRLTNLNYQHLRPGVRLEPMGPELQRADSE